MAIGFAIKHGAMDVAFYALVVAVIGAWLAYKQFRAENPKS
jgi:hypothetical protein